LLACSTKNTFADFAPWRELIVFFSRRGAGGAEKTNVCFVLTPDTFAGFAPWRDFIVFFSPRRQGRQEIHKSLII
jgi:hypothetical protein